jgi:hypothetical protein
MQIRTLGASLIAVILALGAADVTDAAQSEAKQRDAKLAGWVEAMKGSPKGPFQAIRWFCADGTDHPAKPYPCSERGGGIQHGKWTSRAQELRSQGFEIANLFAEIEPNAFSGANPDLEALKQILIERFLVQADDGWIFRGARSYRGAFQIEDEEAGAAATLSSMAGELDWRTPARYALLREAVRLFPRKADSTTATHVRQLAVVIADKDNGFAKLRAKIHNAPDAGDAASVRAYASASGKPALKAEYTEIADAIDSLYAATGAVDALREIAERSPDEGVARKLRAAAGELAAASNPSARFQTASRVLRELRDRSGSASNAESVLALLRASLVVEGDAYVTGNTLLGSLNTLTRLDRLRLLGHTASALYGSGFISSRHLREVRARVDQVQAQRTLTVEAYREVLAYLARAPEWASRWLAFHFERPTAKLSQIEPLAHLYMQDRLRGSPLLFYSALIDSLGLDANQLSGIQHVLFGQSIGAGLRALNPGLTRGVLRKPSGHDFRRDGIYLLPETASELPRVAGILTLGEGSSLSHVQLLARNLGVPNVVVGDDVLPTVNARVGQKAVLAVSPGGVVQLTADGPGWDPVFGVEAAAGNALVIRPDLEKLDLDSTAMVPLSRLRATDSGRSSGPKGANLGELKHHFGDSVPPGFVIPFAAFRKVLDQPIEAGGPSVFEWMKERYAFIATQKSNPTAQQATITKFLGRLRHWIENCDPGADFRQQLKTALQQNFGADGSFGVFIRSDTNVEDLPGFTGAGLNLTVPNVVGYSNILDAIRRVWASPFEDRAYGWRQGNMEDPEYVFPAVVVQYSFPAEKSGVMVTADVDTGDLDIYSVAVSEGVGGAVEGQAAESLHIDRRTGKVEFLAQATAPLRTALPLTGGIAKLPTSGTEELLKPGEVKQLIDMAQTVSRFPTLRDEAGQLLPADIEFAFKDGKLALLQIRPFVESKSAQRNLYLNTLDDGIRQRSSQSVDLRGVPKGGAR